MHDHAVAGNLAVCAVGAVVEREFEFEFGEEGDERFPGRYYGSEILNHQGNPAA